MAEPLPRELQLLNQRLLSAHCMPEKKLRELTGEATFENAISDCNEQLEYAGLEIRGMSLKGTRYYAMINKYPDEIAEKTLLGDTWHVSEVAYVRRVLQALAESTEQKQSTLLNLRNEMEKDKISLLSAEQVLDKLIEEKWIQYVDENKRKSNGAMMELAPRAYLELGHILQEYLEDMPQIFYHRK